MIYFGGFQEKVERMGTESTREILGQGQAEVGPGQRHGNYSSSCIRQTETDH